MDRPAVARYSDNGMGYVASSTRGRSPIRAGAICPGVIGTEMANDVLREAIASGGDPIRRIGIA